MFRRFREVRRRPFLPLVILLCAIVTADTILAVTDHAAEAIGLLAFVAPLVLIVAQGSETHATTIDTNRKVDDMLNGVLERKMRRVVGIELARFAVEQEMATRRALAAVERGEQPTTPIVAVPIATAPPSTPS